MRRAIKFICAVGFYISALIPGGFALVLFSNSGRLHTSLYFSVATIFLALALCLIWAGSYLVIHQSRRTSTRAKFLITSLILCDILAAAIVVPNFVRKPVTSTANSCINNLRQIDAAANYFSLEHHLTNGDAIHFPSDLTLYIKLNAKWEIPPCPAGGHYSISRVGETPICSLGTTVTPSHVLP